MIYILFLIENVLSATSYISNPQVRLFVRLRIPSSNLSTKKKESFSCRALKATHSLSSFNPEHYELRGRIYFLLGIKNIDARGAGYVIDGKAVAGIAGTRIPRCILQLLILRCH